MALPKRIEKVDPDEIFGPLTFEPQAADNIKARVSKADWDQLVKDNLDDAEGLHRHGLRWLDVRPAEVPARTVEIRGMIRDEAQRLYEASKKT